MTLPAIDQSSGARARRRAKNDALLQQQVRQAKLISVVIVTGILIVLVSIGRALGWW